MNLKISDRKSTRLNSSHLGISYAVFCLKKKKADDMVKNANVILTGKEFVKPSILSSAFEALIAAIYLVFFFLNDTATTEIYTLPLHDALPILAASIVGHDGAADGATGRVSHVNQVRSEEHTSELQSLRHLVCRLLLEKKK